MYTDRDTIRVPSRAWKSARNCSPVQVPSIAAICRNSSQTPRRRYKSVVQPTTSNERQEPARRVGDTALAIAREARSLLLQSTLMHRDLLPSVPSTIVPGQPIVIVLHGLFATAGALRPLRKRIEAATGHATASFTYAPGSNLRALVARLRRLLYELPDNPISMVGHSMGGLVARYCVQVGDRDPRVRRTISLASPFFGSRIAHYVPRALCPGIEPGSPALDELLRNHDRGAHVPHTSIASTHDQLVWPWHSAVYPHGRSVVVQARGHNTLLFDPDVAARVIEALKEEVSVRPRVCPTAVKNLPLAS
jgi:pimeloyl-ACP methyl ester carboxylesterase